MGDVINLNHYRKARGRADDAKRAETNRRRYGRTKAEREKEARDLAQAKRRQDQLRLDQGAESEPGPKEPPKSA